MAVVESRGIIEAPDPAQVANGNGYGGLSSLPLSFPREPDGSLEPNDLQQLQRRGDTATFTENGEQNSLQQLHTRSSGAIFTKNGEQNSFHTRDNGASFTENGEQNSLQQLHIRGSGAAFTKNGEQNSFQTRDNGASFTENDEQNSLQHLHIRGSGATFTKNGEQNSFQTRDNGATFAENGEQNSLQQLHIRGSGVTFTKNGEQNSFQTRDNGAVFTENGEQTSLQPLQIRGAAFTENRDGHGSPFDNRNTYNSDSMRELEDFLSNLNPFAKEFVPPGRGDGSLSPFMDNNRGRKKNGSGQGKRRTSTRASRAQREDCVRRTVYVSDIDQQVTEEQLAALFITCGQVVDCRVCGDPNSVLRFAFVEFTDEEGARAALNLSGTMLGYYPVRVLPSKTAIVPVNPTFLPQSEDEREMCSRTIYCTNIDKKVSQADVRLFFESLCGEVSRLRLLGDHHHSTRIAFVEFVQARSAMAALNCSGAILGSLPIRVSPSKTPVRPRFPRTPLFQYAMAFQHVF